MTDFLPGFDDMAAEAAQEAANKAAKARRHAPDPKKLARAEDPQTAKEAARKQVEDGTNATHMARVENAAWLTQDALGRPGTAHEIAERSGLDHVETQRRLSQLVSEGRMEKDTAVQCECQKCKSSRTRGMITWRPK